MADLAAIYGAFRVDEPIPADDDARYVDLAHVRGQIKVAARLAERVKRAGPSPSHHLLMGHTKCGKTTELNRVALRLRQERYVVVVVDVEATLGTRSFEYTTVLLLVAAQIEDQLRREYHLDMASTSARLAEFLREKEVTRGVTGSQDAALKGEMEAGFLSGLLGKLGLGIELRGGFQRSREITEKIEQDTRGFMELLQELVAQAGDRVTAAGFHGLVVICDGCDKLDLSATDRAGNPYDLQYSMFVDHQADLCDIPCHVIYTVPISIRANLGDIWEQTPVLVPAIPVNHLPDIDDRIPAEGRAALTEVVSRRLGLLGETVESSFDEPRLLERLLSVSGGHISDLLLLIREAADEALLDERTTIGEPHVNRAIRNRGRDYSQLIERPFLETLHEIDRTKTCPAWSDEYRELIFKRLVLEYACGDDDTRVDLHPLVLAADSYRRFAHARSAAP